MMKRLWIVTELFYPEETATAYILTKIANHLVGKMDVNVVCGPASYEGGARLCDRGGVDERVRVHRVSKTRFGKNGLVSRVLRFVGMTWRLTRELKDNLREGDEVLVVTNPAPLLLAAAAVRRKRGNKLHLLVHDVFPENTIPAGIVKSENSLFYRLLKSRFDKAYSAADNLIVLGRDMKDVVCQKIGGDEGKVVVIENWADLDNIAPEVRNDDGKVVLQYAGNLGRVQGMMELLKCVKGASNEELSMNFYGSGAVEENMIDYVKKEGMQNVSFHGAYLREEQNRILNSCDLAVITLAKGMYGLGVPSKTYNILAAGKPILYIGDPRSEVAQMIDEYGVGYVFASEDVDVIVGFLKGLSSNKKQELVLMGNKARELAESKYSEKVLLDRYLEVLG